MKISKLFFLVTILFFLNTDVSNSQTWQWAKSFSGTGYETPMAIAADALHNSYFTGRFTAACQIGANTLTGPVGNNIFLAKLNSAGVVQWAKAASGPGNDWSFDVEVDLNGNVFITGYFESTIIFSGTSITSNGGKDCFIAKYNSLGNCLWVRNLGSNAEDYGNSVALDNSGNVFVTGFFSDSLFVGNTVLHSVGTQDIFVAKYDNSGNFNWIKSIGNVLTSEVGGVSVDNSGYVYVAGSFEGTLYSDSFSVSNNAYYDLFLAKFDNNGNIIWLKDGSSQLDNDEVYCTGSGVDNSGNIYLCGYFTSALNFGNNQVVPYYFFNSDAFLCKFDSSGNHQWIVHGGGGGSDEATDLSCDNNGNIFLTGGFFGNTSFNVQFGNVFVNSTQNTFASTFLVKYDQAGNAIWGINEIQSNYNTHFGNIYARDSAIYNAGVLTGTATVGPFSFNGGIGGDDILLGKLVDLTTGLEEHENPQQFAMYPNPVNSTLYVHANQKCQVQIFNILGENITPALDFRNPGIIEIDVSFINPGVYSVLVNNSARVFIKQ